MRDNKGKYVDSKDIQRRVIGRWRGIFAGIGVDLPESPRKHAACPLCGPGNNSHRFRFDDLDGTGTWICTCGSGNGWELYKAITNTDFETAISQVSKVIGGIEYKRSPTKPKIDPRRALNELWRNSSPISGADQAAKYLRARKLTMLPKNVRFCPECYESSTKTLMPAMIAMITGQDDKPITLHRTYLDGCEKALISAPKKLFPGIRPVACSAIRLYDVGSVLGLAEGIETAIAARQLFDIPTWSVISTSIMEGFEPPDGVTNVVIFGDNDPNFAGQKSAYKLANRLYLKDFIVEVQIPDKIGDWADILLDI